MNIYTVKSPRFETQIKFVPYDPDNSKNKIADFEAKTNETTVRYNGSQTTIYCGIGQQDEWNTKNLQSAGVAAIKTAQNLKRSEISVIFPDFPGVMDHTCAKALTEGCLLGTYSFSRYQQEKASEITTMELVTPLLDKKTLNTLQTIIEAVQYCRDLVNENADVVTPDFLAVEALSIAKKSKLLSCTVLTEKEIQRQKLGLIEAVGRGSAYPPRLIILEYRGSPKNKMKIALVGKGITFDAGGLNLKPTGSIETMRGDMAGAAAVLGVLKAAHELKLPVNVVGVISAAQNAISGSSYFPGDVYRSYSGKTVEISNTDAEGRLILADAISYTQKHYKPTELIDIATLTGSIVSALGNSIAGCFSNTDSMVNLLLKCSAESGETLWHMPIVESYRDKLKSDIADLRNTARGQRNMAGAIYGALFLQSFVESIPWAHLDIAGTAFNELEERNDMPKNGTGFGVRLLLTYLGSKFGITI